MTELRNTDDNENNEDQYTKAIGELGRWQIFVFLITALPIKMVLPSVHFGIVMMAPKTTYRCSERHNSTEQLENMTCYSDCNKYEYFSAFKSTIIEEWELICDRAWLADFAQTICVFGMLVGSVLFGFISDRYGRRMTLIISGILETCMSFTMPFCTNFWYFLVTRFLIGGATGGTMMTSFVLLMEIFGPRKRDLLGVIYMLPLTLGHILVSVIAFYFRTWRGFSFGLAIPTLIYLTYIFCLPESPKWLISVGRLEEACIVMTSAAKWNRLPTDNMEAIVKNIANETDTNKKSQRKAKLIHLVTLPSLRIKTLCSCLIWFICGLSVYGSLQYFGQTTSNVLMTFSLIGLVAAPSYFLGGYVSNVFGRRVAVTMFFTIFCIGNGILALPDEWYNLKLIAGIIGVSSGSATFSLVYVFTAELFPTVARNMGTGASSTANRIGGMLAPFIGGLRIQAGWIPPVVFSVVPIVGVVACWCLPETRGKKIEDHIEED